MRLMLTLLAATGLGALAAPAPAAEGDLAAEVAQVFETHCARCHQEGKLKPTLLKPAGGLGHILDLAKLTTNPKHVQRGNPSASLVYSNVVNGVRRQMI